MSIKDTRSILFVGIVLLFGCLVGSILTELFIYILPEGVVKEFFTNTWTILGWGNENGWIDFSIIKFRFDIYIKVSVLSLIGMMISWYFLRYFR